MGLSVYIEGAGAESHDFEAGAYSRYSRFRHALIAAIRGKKAAQRAAEKQQADSYTFLFGKDPQMMAIMGALTNKRARVEEEETEEEQEEAAEKDDLDLFLDHSDCDGEFSHQDAKKIYPVFKENRAKFKKSKPEEGFMELYDDFLKAFRIVGKEEERKDCLLLTLTESLLPVELMPRGCCKEYI